MIICAFDPGSSSSGWATLESFGCPPTVKLMASGEANHSPYDWYDIMRGADIVAIERVKGVVYGPKGAGIVPHLLEASWACGGIYAVAIQSGIRVVDMPAVEWRKIVCGKSNASDALVKSSVYRFVKDMPKRTNSHVRDAVGCGLAVAWNNIAPIWVT